MANRWYVLRALDLGKGNIPAGRYLDDEEEKQIDDRLARVLLNAVRLFDVSEQYLIDFRERNKVHLQMVCLAEIATPLAKQISDRIILAAANQRREIFKSPAERAIADEIVAGAGIVEEDIIPLAYVPPEEPKAAPVKEERSRRGRKKKQDDDAWMDSL